MIHILASFSLASNLHGRRWLASLVKLTKYFDSETADLSPPSFPIPWVTRSPVKTEITQSPHGKDIRAVNESQRSALIISAGGHSNRIPKHYRYMWIIHVASHAHDYLTHFPTVHCSAYSVLCITDHALAFWYVHGSITHCSVCGW